MLTAKLNETIIDLKPLSKSQIIEKYPLHLPYTCPDCEGELILKYGLKKRAHFAHKNPCDYAASESESKEHLFAKSLLFSYLERQGAVAITLEKRFKDISRIADLYFEWQGRPYVIEIQKSVLSQHAFESRTSDYQSKGIKVIWIFIGDLKEKSHTYLLNKVMILNKASLIIHLNLLTEEVSLFHQIIWLNQKEVKAQVKRCFLKNLLMSDLLQEQVRDGRINLSEWLAIKKEFRVHKWQYYLKGERVLARLCYSKRMSLSLLPAEVGWPVAHHEGIKQPLFIWQAYVLLGGVMAYELGSFFTLTDLVARLKNRYRLPLNQQSIKALKAYLQVLQRLDVIQELNGYYEIKREVKAYEQLEQALQEDLRLGQLLK